MNRRNFLTRAAAAVAGFFGLGAARASHWPDWKTEQELQAARVAVLEPTFTLRSVGRFHPKNEPVPVFDSLGNQIGTASNFRNEAGDAVYAPTLSCDVFLTAGSKPDKIRRVRFRRGDNESMTLTWRGYEG